MHNVDGHSIAPFWSNHNHPIRKKFSILRLHNVDGRFVAPFWSNHNDLIRQKLSILRLEVAKDIT
jgi:hypothetical protein